MAASFRAEVRSARAARAGGSPYVVDENATVKGRSNRAISHRGCDMLVLLDELVLPAWIAIEFLEGESNSAIENLIDADIRRWSEASHAAGGYDVILVHPVTAHSKATN